MSDILCDSQREEWFYCPGPQNPADLPSRGMYGPHLERNLFGWEGPGFLKHPSTNWPKQEVSLESKSALEDGTQQVHSVTHVLASKEILNVSKVMETERSSSYRTCVHTLAWVVRFINNLSASLANNNCQRGHEASKEEVDNVENVLIRSI